MIRFYKNSWQHTIGFLILIKNADFKESSSEEGYLHFAEHLMFCETQKFSTLQLRQKFDEIFKELEASTYRDEVRIFGRVAKENFREAMKVLEQMIYHWQCPKGSFDEQKKMVLEEIRAYSKDYRGLMLREVAKFLPEASDRVMGKLEQIKKIDWGKVDKIKRVWDGFVKSGKFSVILTSDNLEKEDLKLAEKIFKTDAEKKGVKRCVISDRGNINNKKISGFWFKSCSRTLNSMLLDRIFYWRWNNNKKLKFDYDFLRAKDMSVFYVFSERGIGDKNEAREFFTKPVSLKEFEWAKKMISEYIVQIPDMLNWKDDLNWIGGFFSEHYAELQTEDMSEIRKYFEELKFEDFEKFVSLAIDSQEI